MSSAPCPPRRPAFPPVLARGRAPLAEPRHRATVLLVDDDIDLVNALRLALRKQPFEILVATSAQQALELFEKTQFDAIVADDRMPLMSGSELLTRVQSASPTTVRILLTGYPTLDATSRAINDGHAFGFLTKPCDSHALAAMLLQALELRA